ncbi:hypothetical protein UFOVP156_47 [uncultured Caudovirales phage]|uniref:Uncharacterized protein n=1 Tax=uncultured Caudovirales phage TaxID=2100421 RepID=A0A6J7WCV1_9CAUD|nr:hypothetical protein UFOVP156_47 [uncultured Caudovirales phage]
MNWMLVLFMGVSPHYNVVKTDLIFSEQKACFAYEETLGKRAADAQNHFLKDWKEGRDNSTTNAAVTWAGMQFVRGTCIPTTSKVTLF